MRREPVVWVLGAIVWLGAVLAGVGVLWAYKSTPGQAGAAPPAWPEASSLDRDAARPTLIMLAHPKCPCTRASLDELSVVMSRFHTQVRAYVLFVRPDGVEPGWEETYSLARARDIPGVTVVVDDAGREAARFGASVSGQTVLYDQGGRLLFDGGITGARGHAGANPGRSRVVSLLASRQPGRAAPTSPVFGCRLADA